MNGFKSKVDWSPKARASSKAVANAIVAWNNGLLHVGRTPEEDVPLPWHWRMVAWGCRKCGIGMLQIVGGYMTIQHWKRRIRTGLAVHRDGGKRR